MKKLHEKFLIIILLFLISCSSNKNNHIDKPIVDKAKILNNLQSVDENLHKWKVYYNENDYEKAALSIEKLLNSKNDFNDYEIRNLFFYKGQMYAFNDDYDKAVKNFKKAQVINVVEIEKSFSDEFLNANQAFIERDYFSVKENLKKIISSRKDSFYYESSFLNNLLNNFDYPYWLALNSQSLNENLIKENLIRIDSINIKFEDFPGSIKINFPVFLEETIINSTINSTIQKKMQEESDEIQDLLKGLEELNPKWEAFLQIDFEVLNYSDSYLSILFNKTTFTGGAHPNHFSFSMNYDRKSGKTLNLEDILIEKEPTLVALSDYCIDVLTRRNVKLFKSAFRPSLETFHTWNILNDSVRFTFDPYDVAAYAEGQYTIIVPFNKIDSHLKINKSKKK